MNETVFAGIAGAMVGFQVQVRTSNCPVTEQPVPQVQISVTERGGAVFRLAAGCGLVGKCPAPSLWQIQAQ